MTRSQPSSLILALLRFVASGNEALAGDLIEEWRRGRPSRWFWRQLLVALVAASWASWRTHSAQPEIIHLIGDAPFDRSSRSLDLIDPATINLSGIKVRGIGGLGLLAAILLITIVIPQAWFLVLAGLTGGIIVGVATILRRHDRGLSGPEDSAPLTLFGSHESSERVPVNTPNAGVIRLATV